MLNHFRSPILGHMIKAKNTSTNEMEFAYELVKNFGESFWYDYY